MSREEFLKQLPELAKGYRPAPDVVNKVNGLQLLMVIGPSGVGKTTVINKLECKYIISDTTRSPRPDEKEGVDYYFRDDYEQIIDEMKNGRFVQVAIDSGGDLKATRAISYPESGTAVMAVVADVIPIFRELGFKKTISVFVTPPSYNEWMKRLSSHDLSPEQLGKRLAEARRSLEFALQDKETYFILNDDLEGAAQQTKNVVEGKVDKEREEQARQVARSLMAGL